jgi:hypothetical protein
MRARRLAAAGFLAATAAAFAGTLEVQAPVRLSHARLETRSAAGGLAAAFRAPAPSPAWFAYAVTSPVERKIRTNVDDAFSWGSRCALEGNGSSFVNVSDGDEARSSRLLLFYRVESGRTTRLRFFSDDCAIEAGGMPVIWLNDVRSADSVAYLESLHPETKLGDRDGDGVSRERLLTAIALHDDPSADASLERFVSRSSPDTLRKKAVFWLGNARGRRGWEILRTLAQSDPSDEVRKSVTFALSQSPVPEATDTLLAMARSDASGRVRGQALFWLAHKAGQKAAGVIEDAIRDDPETEVKKKAVFALTQLPNDQSVTQLIHVAKSNRSPEVRKQALFWLGQSKDARALAYIEEVLTR